MMIPPLKMQDVDKCYTVALEHTKNNFVRIGEVIGTVLTECLQGLRINT